MGEKGEPRSRTVFRFEDIIFGPCDNTGGWRGIGSQTFEDLVATRSILVGKD